jgi:hypothetical protein
VIMTAEELEERPVVFALAQQPHELNQGEFIATLWPLMCFSTGFPVDASSFRTSGYVRWYRVPLGDWKHGDLVLGTLRRNERGFNLPDKEWFQVYADAGEHPGGRVCEVFEIPESIHKLGELLRRPVREKRVPRGDVYFRCTDAVVGPFRVEQGEGAKAGNLYFTPERRAGCDVDVFDRHQFDNAGISIVRTNAVLSPSEIMPTHAKGETFQTTYQIFRGQDLEAAGLQKQVRYFMTDESLVRRACKQIKHGKNWKKLRDELLPLVALLEEDSTDISEAVVQGLPNLLGDAERRVAATEPLVAAIMNDDEIDGRIEQRTQSVIQAKVDARAAEIEELAKSLASAKLAALEKVEAQVKDLEVQKVKLEQDVAKLKNDQEQTQSRAEKLLSTVKERLQTGRYELMTDLALLGPLIQNNGAAVLMDGSLDTSPNNWHVARVPSPGMAVPLIPQRQLTLPYTPAPTSPSLAESDFVTKRLWPLLGLHGASVTRRDSELFHATVVASQLIGIPHPGWASGYAEAMGETANCVTVSVSPKWLDFDSAFRGAFADQWRVAINEPTRVHLFVLEGIDRCPTHAWLRPWLSVLAGWSKSLPDEQQTRWPLNIRLCITEEKSTACFEVPKELRHWILYFEPKGIEETIPEKSRGHLSIENWSLEHAETDDTFDGFIRSLELPRNEPFFPYRRKLAKRLRSVLLRLNPNEEFTLDNLVALRLFSCWNAKGEV